MILPHRPNQRPRTGAIAPLAAIMLVFFMFLVAVAVDLGYIANVRAELQNAADSAALAGASQLLDNNILKGTPDQDNAMANARAQAQLFAGSNHGGGVALTLGNNANNDSGGDVYCGYLSNPADRSQPMIAPAPLIGPYPNSVQVQVHRDSTRNSPLSLFFARALGTSSLSLQATQRLPTKATSVALRSRVVPTPPRVSCCPMRSMLTSGIRR